MEVINGAKLWWIIASLCIGLLLSSLESTIVSTALVRIGADFNNFQQSNWIVISYLLTYSSFLIIFARLSDVTGRKLALLTALCIFTIASLACGLAQTMLQLIVFRAFQGIGGSGIYALSMVIVADVTPKERLGGVSAMVNSVFVVASAVGPIIGGAIATFTTWRWCFYFNVPAGALTIAVISFTYPEMEGERRSTLKDLSRRVDWLGLLMCLAASIIIIVPIQEGGIAFAWSSTLIITLLAVGGFCWLAFACWETWLARVSGDRIVLPMVPHQAVIHRIIGACIVTSFLTGIAFTSIVIYLPQRFQAVNALSPVEAGVRVLPVLLVSAFGATASGLALSKRNLCSYFIIAGTALQLLGLGLYSTLSTAKEVPTTSYVYQSILGLGLGTTLSSSFILARVEIPRREDIAAMVGCITQLRVFGGVVGVVICRVSQDSYLRAHLLELITPSVLGQVMSSLASLSMLEPAQSQAVRQIYGDSFNQQHRILAYIAAVNLVASLFTFRIHATPIRDPIQNSSVEEQAKTTPESQGTELTTIKDDRQPA